LSCGSPLQPTCSGRGEKPLSEHNDFVTQILAEMPWRDEHCDRLFWLAQEDMPERGVVKGEPYCAKCPRIPLIGTHCCLARGCKERIEEAKRRFKENWNKIHGEDSVERRKMDKRGKREEGEAVE